MELLLGSIEQAIQAALQMYVIHLVIYTYLLSIYIRLTLPICPCSLDTVIQ